MSTPSTFTMLHILDADQQPQGPFTPAQLREMIRTGRASFATPAAVVGDDEWVPLSTFDDLLREPQRTVVSATVAPEPATTSEFNFAKAGAVLLGISVVLALLLGPGLFEVLLLAAGIGLLVVGLCKK